MQTDDTSNTSRDVSSNSTDGNDITEESNVSLRCAVQTDDTTNTSRDVSANSNDGNDIADESNVSLGSAMQTNDTANTSRDVSANSTDGNDITEESNVSLRCAVQTDDTTNTSRDVSANSNDGNVIADESNVSLGSAMQTNDTANTSRDVSANSTDGNEIIEESNVSLVSAMLTDDTANTSCDKSENSTNGSGRYEESAISIFNAMQTNDNYDESVITPVEYFMDEPVGETLAQILFPNGGIDVSEVIIDSVTVDGSSLSELNIVDDKQCTDTDNATIEYLDTNMEESTDEECGASNYNPEPERKKRKKKEVKELKENPPIKEGCNEKCSKKCMTKIDENRRNKIWDAYWNLSYNNKRNMIFKHVNREPTKRVTAGTDSRRNMSFTYTFDSSDGTSHQVCKTFFLATLGYHHKNDRIISTVMATTAPGSIVAANDSRGQQPAKNKFETEPICKHVETFNPTISHYRREHAPNRRYLPSDVTVKAMHEDFQLKNPDQKCHYEMYRKTVASMNISFTKLGEEECEKCTKYDEHIKLTGHARHIDKDANNEELQEECDMCINWRTHINSAKISRAKYQSDIEIDGVANTSVRSVDLKKVIMLPRMPGNKTAIFTKRIIVFHETFAAVGKRYTKKRLTISVVWHEGIAGRICEAISSAYVAALKKERDQEHIIIWLDNCTAQNKNWSLLTALVHLVNSDTMVTKDITLKFFTAGHTFMSADSFHHGVEREMKNRPCGNVLDIDDFVDVVSKSNAGKVDVVVLENDQVLDFKGGQSTYKLKKSGILLTKMSQIQVRKGERSLYFKVSHDDDVFTKLDFLKTNVKLSEAPRKLRETGRGIPQAKKDDIVSKLCPMMPSTRRHFWINLPVGNEAEEIDG